MPKNTGVPKSIRESMTDFPGPHPEHQLDWIRGDLHNHCELPELIEEMFADVDSRLDFAALTNHAQKDVFFSQHEMIAQARALQPDFPLFFGMEWNSPGGQHANLVFPPTGLEHERAYSFSRAFDRKVAGSDPDVERALNYLGQLPVAEQPLLFFNHPMPGYWSAAEIASFCAADATAIVCGIEAVHGHQALARAARWGHDTYPGCAVGGLADQMYAQNRVFSLLCNSDFHVHKQQRDYDYPLGVFNHTCVGVAPGDRSPEGIFAALRAGRTCAAQGRWLDLGDFSITSKAETTVAVIGDRWRGVTGEPGILSIRFVAAEAVRSAAVIGRLAANDDVAILHDFSSQPAGEIECEIAIPAGSDGFVRLRVISDNEDRPAPGPRAPKGFFTSAILLG